MSNYSLMLLGDVCNLQVMGQSLYSIHWNLVSPHFLSIHKFTDEQHSIMLTLLDELAERIRAIGMKIPTSLSDVFKFKTIKEVCLFNSEQTDYQCLYDLLSTTQDAHAHLTQTITEAGACNDLGTQEILIKVEKAIAKQIWLIQSQGVSVTPITEEVPIYE